MPSPAPAAALLFALGPVQDFIATARKGQDLWFGSWLLSDLARAAAQAAVAVPGVDLVLPTRLAVAEGDAVANKILLRVPSGGVDGVAEKMRIAVAARLRHIRDEAFGGVISGAGAHAHLFHQMRAEAQVEALVETYWVAVDEVAGRWGETRRRAESALAARKSVRDFAPVTWGAPVPKSRLDGQRESVIDEKAFDLPAERLRTAFGVGKGERLCGVGLLKRHGWAAVPDHEARRGRRVLSTAHVASWSLRRAWSDEALASVGTERASVVRDELARHGRAYVAQLRTLGGHLSAAPQDPVLGSVDGQVLYAGRLRDIFDGDEACRSAQGVLASFLRTVGTVLESAALPRPGAPSPYYAVLRADGDHMGRWLDGMEDPAQHQSASDALRGFARNAVDTVERFHGHCVFAGGDDVLALVPVQTALDCAVALNADFAGAIRAGPAVKNRPTLSVGLQIAHATDPFREALDGAAVAEQSAKHKHLRDAWVVRLEKRSGSPIEVGGHWGALESFRRLQDLQERGANGLPRGLGYDLRRVADRLQGETNDALARIRALEVERVLAQKDIDPASPGAVAIWRRLGGTDATPRPGIDAAKLVSLCDEIIVARALAALDGDAE